MVGLVGPSLTSFSCLPTRFHVGDLETYIKLSPAIKGRIKFCPLLIFRDLKVRGREEGAGGGVRKERKRDLPTIVKYLRSAAIAHTNRDLACLSLVV